MNVYLSRILTCSYLGIAMLTAFDARALETPTFLAQFGQYPLCEASAARFIPCPDGAGNCLLVGDNEQNSTLFLIRGNSALPYAAEQNALKLPDEEVSDIEALALMPSGEVFAFGSHSRNSACEAKGKRRRFVSVRLTTAGVEISKLVKSKKISCRRLFGDVTDRSPVQQAVCLSIDQAEHAANNIEKQLKDEQIEKEQARTLCEQVTPFNAEGAVTITHNNTSNIWIGLRAPLLDAHPVHAEYTRLAITLRLNNTDEYSFDASALLDLGGRGIREMTQQEDWLWVIAGPASDRAEPFQLWRFKTSALVPDAIINPELITTLPSSSEGLAISASKAYVLIDGDAGENRDSRCLKNSRFMILDLSN